MVRPAKDHYLSDLSTASMLDLKQEEKPCFPRRVVLSGKGFPHNTSHVARPGDLQKHVGCVSALFPNIQCGFPKNQFAVTILPHLQAPAEHLFSSLRIIPGDEID